MIEDISSDALSREFAAENSMVFRFILKIKSKIFFKKIWNNLLQKIEFDVRVLANGKKTWPFFMGSASSVSLSAEPLIAYETFRDFYLAKHNKKQIGRRLTLQPTLGSASIEAVFHGSGPSGEPKKSERPIKAVKDIIYSMLLLSKCAFWCSSMPRRGWRTRQVPLFKCTPYFFLT